MKPGAPAVSSQRTGPLVTPVSVCNRIFVWLPGYSMYPSESVMTMRAEAASVGILFYP